MELACVGSFSVTLIQQHRGGGTCTHRGCSSGKRTDLYEMSVVGIWIETHTNTKSSLDYHQKGLIFRMWLGFCDSLRRWKKRPDPPCPKKSNLIYAVKCSEECKDLCSGEAKLCHNTPHGRQINSSGQNPAVSKTLTFRTMTVVSETC